MSEDADIRDALAEFAISLGKLVQHTRMSYADYEEIMRYGFVKAAEQQIKKETESDKVSMARISARTGLSRREVRRQAERTKDFRGVRGHRAIIAPAFVVEHWSSDPRYLDSRGEPRRIVFDNPSEPNFVTLVSEASSDSTPVSILQELKDANCVEESSDGILTLVSKYFAHADVSGWVRNTLTGHLKFPLETVLYNIDALSRDELAARTCRFIFSDQIPITNTNGAATAIQSRLRACNSEMLDLVEAFEQEIDVSNGRAVTAIKNTQIGVTLCFYEST